MTSLRKGSRDRLRAIARTPPVRRFLLPAVQRLVRGGWVLSGPGRGLRLELAGGNPGILLGMTEPPVQEFVMSLTDRDVFYDIGANIGFYTLLAARRGARVYAFEPHPKAAAVLRRNLARNNLRATVNQVALGDRDGSALLDVRRIESARLAEVGEPVRLVRGDGLDLPDPTAVKIDVDGTEVAVLTGMRGLLVRSRPRIALELHGTLDECEEVLRALGFQWTVVDDGGMPHLFTA